MPPKYSPPESHLRNRRIALMILSIFSIGVLCLIIYSVLGRKDYLQAHIQTTTLSQAENFAVMSQNTLYAYNGLAFYSQNVESGEIKVLSTGQKLPAPKRVYWAGDKGALITFDHSFLATSIYAKLQSEGLNPTEHGANTLWYMDFSTGELTLVEKTLPEEGLVTYQSQHDGFYYIINSAESDQEQLPYSPELRFFKIDTRSTAKIATIHLDAISNIQSCDPAKTTSDICIIGNMKNTDGLQRIYSINQFGSMAELYNPNGRIFTTNIGGKYIVAPLAEADKKTTTTDEVETDYAKTPAKLYDTSTKRESALGFDIETNNVSAHFVDASSFFVFGASDSNNVFQSYYSGVIDESGKASTKSLRLKDETGTPFQQTIIGTKTSGPGSIALTLLDDGSNAFFIPTDDQVKVSPADMDTAESTVKNCSEQSGGTYEFFEDDNLFKIYLPENSTLSASIENISDCLVESEGGIVASFNFYISTTSPVNGRITSD